MADRSHWHNNGKAIQIAFRTAPRLLGAYSSTAGQPVRDGARGGDKPTIDK